MAEVAGKMQEVVLATDKIIYRLPFHDLQEGRALLPPLPLPLKCSMLCVLLCTCVTSSFLSRSLPVKHIHTHISPCFLLSCATAAPPNPCGPPCVQVCTWLAAGRRVSRRR